MTPTIIFEDNSACVTQMESGYIKSNMTKHIILKLFYPHELQKNGEIESQSAFRKLSHVII